jgi:hypothetical protein
MHVSILEDMHEPGGCGLLCSGANSRRTIEMFCSLRCRKDGRAIPRHVWAAKEDEHEDHQIECRRSALAQRHAGGPGRCGSLTMHVLCVIGMLLLDLRAHIPNQPRFGSGPAQAAHAMPLIRVLAAFLITVAFLLAVLWLAVRLMIGFL